MTPSETILWSAVLGSLGLIVFLGLAELAYSRSLASAQNLAFLFSSWGFALLLSGLPLTLLPSLELAWLQVAQVLIGPLASALGSYGASLWLAARKRDRLLAVGLRITTVLGLAGAPACLLLAVPWQLPAAACLTVLNLLVALWLSVRAAQLGDRMAWGLALACLLTLPFQIGMYAMVIGSRLAFGWQAVIALFGLLGFGVFGLMLWLRSRQQLSARRDVPSEIDPITQLFGSMALVQKIIAAQRRQAATDSNGVLLAVLIFEPEKIAAEVGQYGLNEIYAELARRTQRQVGVLNPVGRYYDRCFVALVETLHSPSLLRTVGLRLASRLRQPVEVASMTGERTTVKVDVGVGLAHFYRGAKDVDQLLHDAQQLAEVARGMRSRTAVLDPASGVAVPVEKAALDGNWAHMRQQMAHVPQDSIALP
ncbi:MAG: hypothetical protein ACKVOO_00170 [Burkholderiaceae bacterium]